MKDRHTATASVHAHADGLALRSTSLALSGARAESAASATAIQRSASMPMREASYAGPDRRRRRVYVTRNTEYHVQDGECVAVRDRRTHEFMHGHLARGRRVEGALKFFPNGSIAPNPGEPRPGESIYFASEGRDLVTSPLERVERPGLDAIDAYPEHR